MGPLLLLGGAAALALAARKKREDVLLGVEINEDCSEVIIVDPPSLEVHFYDIYLWQRNEGVEDPFEIADAMVRALSPECRKFPEDLRSPGELELYSRALQFATVELTREKGFEILKHPDAANYGKWLESQRNRLTPKPHQTSQVMFIEDGDIIQIGTKWVDEVLEPTLTHVKENLGMLWTKGTALTVAAMVIKNTEFIDQDGNPIEVDLKSSPGGQKFLQEVTAMVERRISSGK